VKKLLVRSEAKHMAAIDEIGRLDEVEGDDFDVVGVGADDEGPDAAASDPSNLDANR
jgi:membrane-associated protein